MTIPKLTLLIITLICLSATAGPIQAQTPQDERVAQIMNQMSVEDKVGQLFIVPFVGDQVNPDSDIWRLLTEYRVGGVILLSANSNFRNDESAPGQITALVNNLQTTTFNTNGIPLFVAIDHEGDAFPFTRISNSLTPIPSQMAIGATWNTANAEAIGQIVGEEMAALGINMVLGPGLDVLNDPRPTGRGDIGIRVFGGDPFWVGQMGRAYIQGIHQGGQGQVITVAKHFPGHGGSDRLPDNEVATVDKSLQELRRIELPPFFEVTAASEDDPQGQTDALMSSHIRYRGFQGDIRQFTAPISFDAAGMSTLLALPQIARWRDDGGLIISDALGVPAVRKHFDPALETFPHRRIAKEALLAGNDILSLVQFDLKSIWSDQFANIKDTAFFFQTEYNNNPTFAARVDAAVGRILRMKLKLYPELTLNDLTHDPGFAMELSNRPRPIINKIAQESLTLLYPSPEELRLRIPAPPRSDEKILIIADSRLARQCFIDGCEPEELYLTRTGLEETILRLYGPGATGQIQPEQVSTITFSELKLALGGSIAPISEPDGQPEVENRLVQRSVDEVRQLIQEADWLIFGMLDLNLSRFSDSDALKLFLAQEHGTMLDKTTIVLAFNAPYYLDTTEVTKLTAYYGVYSKTQPHLEAAVRAVFGEIGQPGAPPVSVEGIGYGLVDVLSPDPDQVLPLEIVDIKPDSRLAPVTVHLRAGPIFDKNGNTVPDDTPVEVKATLNGREIAADNASTVAGVAQTALTLNESGQVELIAWAGPGISSREVSVSVEALPTVTPSPTVSPTATPVLTEPSPSPSPNPSPTPPEPVQTDTPIPIASANEPASPPNEANAAEIQGPRSLDQIDLLSALTATLLAGLLGFWLGQQAHSPLSRRLRTGLWVLIGGLAAYLLYGVGLIRPERWLFDNPDVLLSRLTLAGLAFIFGILAVGLSNERLLARKR